MGEGGSVRERLGGGRGGGERVGYGKSESREKERVQGMGIQ